MDLPRREDVGMDFENDEASGKSRLTWLLIAEEVDENSESEILCWSL